MRRRLATLLDVPDETNLLDLLANASLEWSGVKVGQPDFAESSRSVALTLRAGPGALHIIFNAYWEPLDFELPELDGTLDGWRRIVDTTPGRTGRSRPHVHRGDAGHDAGLPRRGALDRDHGRPTRRGNAKAKDRESMTVGAERARMADAGHPEDGWREASPWYQWGPYLSERAWGSVREDYSADGDAWNSFPHDHARSRVYRWNEDGMAGLSDVFGRLCLGLSLWNGVDPILKERMFGLTNQEGNHGEDSKDYWWYLDALPSGAWLRWRYHYPQAPFPYEDLIEENARRSKFDREYELLDTGVFDDDRYWIVEVHYAKADPTDILMRVVVRNRGPEEATLHVLPTLWFRNEWSFDPDIDKPTMLAAVDEQRILVKHAVLGDYTLEVGDGPDGTVPDPVVLRERNERGSSSGTSRRPPRIRRTASTTTSCMARTPSIPSCTGTKAAPWYVLTVPAGGSAEVRLRLHRTGAPGSSTGKAEATTGSNAKRSDLLGKPFDALMREREAEADEFYEDLRRDGGTDEEQLVMRQAFAGMLWSKQYYGYDVARWLDGDPGQPAPPYERHTARNAAWRHFDSADILSMPDPWEYPWFAAWDLAFHAVTLAHVDPAFAKYQLLLLCREWFQHPDGALPAYEWSFDDVNPPVHAAAALLVFDIDGRTDLTFLKRIFHKLLMNFTWWLNREDREGNDLFGGGFLGPRQHRRIRSIAPARRHRARTVRRDRVDVLLLPLDAPHRDGPGRDRPGVRGPHDELPRACRPDLGGDEPERDVGRDRRLLLRRAQARRRLDASPIKVHSMVGLIPLLPSAVVPAWTVDRGSRARQTLRPVPRGHERHRTSASARAVSSAATPGHESFMISVVPPARFTKLLARDAVGGCLPRADRPARPVQAPRDASRSGSSSAGSIADVDYEPGESTSGLFGGNSNWRGPIWFPLNYLTHPVAPQLG